METGFSGSDKFKSISPVNKRQWEFECGDKSVNKFDDSVKKYEELLECCQNKCKDKLEKYEWA